MSMVGTMVSTKAYNVKVQPSLSVTNDAEYDGGMDRAQPQESRVSSLSKNQKEYLYSLTAIHSNFDCRLSMTPFMGDESGGLYFDSLGLLGLDCALTTIRVEIANGAVAAFWLFYDDGSIFSRGKTRGGNIVALGDLNADEKIIAARIEIGKESSGSYQSKEARITSLHFIPTEAVVPSAKRQIAFR